MTVYKKRGDISEESQKELAEYSSLIQKLLFFRGITTKKEADNFLNPVWDEEMYNPFGILNMEKAVERILIAIEEKEHIVIYGDYDADGIPGSTVLHDFFKKIEYENFSNYIPHRHDEGYGINTNAIGLFEKDGVTLMITVDVGITDVDAVTVAQEKGIDVIVTDHHLPLEVEGKEVIPPAYAVVNSKQKDDTYIDDMLCGAGVAFKLVQALLLRGRERGLFEEIPIGWEKWLLDMAGLSTVSDMVPLKKENRILAHFGLQVMRKSKRKGLLALLRKMKMKQVYITEDDIGFMIAPRINAASRMDHPLRAFELLSSTDEARAERLATHLEDLNNKRKGQSAAMTKEAHKKLNDRELSEVIVVGSTEWAPGLLGLVANKIVEKYSRPAYVWGHDAQGNIKGSCRSAGDVSVVDLMRACPENTFLQFGGHAEAGGFSVDVNNIHTLEEILSKTHRTMEKKVVEDVWIDDTLTLDDVNIKRHTEIEQLAPFGVANKKPLFVFENVVIDESRLFGKEKNHLGLDFRNSSGKKVSAIGFFLTKESFPDVRVEQGEPIHLLAVMEKSYFRGFAELRLRIIDIMSSDVGF